MATLILAIDFGTTTTVVCGDIQGVGNPIFLKDENSSLIPSLIFIKNDGTRYYGKRAEVEQERNTNRGLPVENFKMGLLSDNCEKYKEYVKDFLKNHIYKLYEQQKTDFPQHSEVIIRISHPSKWPKELIQFMVEAVKFAGFTGNVETVAEPLAISTYSLLSHQEDLKNKHLLDYNTEYNVMICDMGGGTTDVVLCKIIINDNGRCKVYDPKTYPKPKSESTCGGSEMDMILRDYVLEKLPQNLHTIFGLHNARRWKEQYVSKDLEADKVSETPSRIMSIMSVLPEYMDRNDLSNICSIDRIRYEQYTSDYWLGFVKLVGNALSDYSSLYDVKQDNIEFLIITGGHSQWYCVSDILINSLNLSAIQKNQSRILRSPNPNETVARGLCFYDSEIICNHYFMEEISYDAYFSVSNHSVSKKNKRNILLDKRVALPFELKEGGESIVKSNHSLKGEIVGLYIDIYVGGRLTPLKSFHRSFLVESYSEGYEYMIEYELCVNINDNLEVNASVNWIEPSWSIEYDSHDDWDDWDDWKGIYDAHIGGL